MKMTGEEHRRRAADEGAPAPFDLPERFEDVYRDDFRNVVGLVYALSGSGWSAEEIAQEAFLAAHKDWERIGRYERPGAWVRRVALNLATSAFRRRLIEARALARFASRRSLPELHPEASEFWGAVRSLPRRQAQVIALHYLEDRPVAEIAEILDCAEGTVKAHLHRARRGLALKLRLANEEGT